ncbi:integrator complex subunit 14 [Rhipicephalus microplus]|uniref:integrator complex subunit 14 n=1 Tax=Rhipicephalus microplus TaxID=6941 RepID=UPI001888C1DE|nr:integrator complex subunit 14-like [Rhipicephalus microplus]XP_037268129.1 integrator complex subunit 14-like [Rhipicephalus microplus]
MPTVILLDVSLSMCRPVTTSDSAESLQLRQLAVHGINAFLDHMAQHCKLEFCAMVVFSSLWELMVPFTRDTESIKATLAQMECHDRTDLNLGLQGARQVLLDEWGSAMPSQVILVTDGALGGWRGCEDGGPGRLHVVCLHPTNGAPPPALSPLGRLAQRTGGRLFVPEGGLSIRSVQQAFLNLAQAQYAPFHGVLRCGQLWSSVSLCPPPEPHKRPQDFSWVQPSTTIQVCGFLGLQHVANPPTLSRHLVLPAPGPEDMTRSTEPKEGRTIEEEEDNDEGKQPSFCVLLHGSLKVEGMVALCQIGPDWYGMLYSWADSKKKSNLMLSTFEPGIEAVPWLGKLDHLGPQALAPSGNETLPVKSNEKHSYSHNSVVWIRQSDLQADIQKILRHARKLPEKTPNFYKELNRLRRAALSLGFHELLEGMATILERECTLLPGSAHPDAALQLSHASSFLRGPSCKDYTAALTPLRTKFSSQD